VLALYAAAGVIKEQNDVAAVKSVGGNLYDNQHRLESVRVLFTREMFFSLSLQKDAALSLSVSLSDLRRNCRDPLLLLFCLN